MANTDAITFPYMHTHDQYMLKSQDNLTLKYIELGGIQTPYLDFHYNNNFDKDYDARLIVNQEGLLDVLAPKGIRINGKWIVDKPTVDAIDTRVTNLEKKSSKILYEGAISADTKNINIPGLSQYTVFAARIESHYSGGAAIGMKYNETMSIIYVYNNGDTVISVNGVWGTNAYFISNIVGLF